MNKCVLTGRLTKKPELREIKDKKVCEFTLATNRPVIRDGEKQADFINCIVWNNQAENLCKYQDKGSLIAVFGEIRTDSYEVEGNKRYKTYVLVNNIEFLERKDLPVDKLSTRTITQDTLNITESDYPF